jgi:hypothetical protein
MKAVRALSPLVIVTPESPWPANHGARVDIWNRWRMLRELGWRLVLVTWGKPHDRRDSGADTALSEVFEHTYWLDAASGLRGLLDRVVGLPRHSPHVWTRRINPVQLTELDTALGNLRPAGVVLDSLYGALAARKIAHHFAVPLLHRAHNIEHLYMAGQARTARSFKRSLTIRLASMHLRRLEMEIHREAAWTFDISQDDLRYWQERGFTRGSWLPPLMDALPIVGAEWKNRSYDVLYLGNLNTPNNVAALAWFFCAVVPELEKLRPSIRIAVSGSNPSKMVRAMVGRCEGACLLENPADVTQIRAQARVLINPARSGSGVNVKSVEMLFTDSPIVATTVGVQGLSPEVQAVFSVTDDPAAFAKLISNGLDQGPVPAEARNAARAAFGRGAASDLSARLVALLG